MTLFAEQLKIHRNKRKLSQEDLARELFISRQAISKWENGEATPDLENLVSLSELLELSLDELVTGKKPPVQIIDKSMNGWEFFTRLGQWFVKVFSPYKWFYILVFLYLFYWFLRSKGIAP
ncbi:helix-turn-helix transcriptional regulator [Streptococcus zalophi]|uniref:Helix-turn-helix transcriptional regulator n=1 Tax=Streptococcus zalophi TaxID=640031 RepID=A0A934PAG8_9STRE|nr:helix-turn-helix transcriptional regulator [Streptococcus zalophi]MBJ8350062.1 helix-turn-helix transcriptional regulator [Streptococcus zalophi]MCR8968162.1 helix-turn-helix domain-containing protein [Streptococcus zalophi]